MATIVYLHGFASVGYSPKSQAIQAVFGYDHQIVAPDLPIDPAKTKQIISDIVRSATSFPIVFVGTSLGGFWANYFSQKYDAPCVLVNPSVTPSKTMYDRVGLATKNYATGENIEVTDKDVAQFCQLEREIDELSNGYLVNLFLAKDDSVIPYLDTLEKIKFSKTLTITENGGHRFEENWNLVIDRIGEVIS